MKMSIEELPDIYDLSPQDVTATVVYEDDETITESNAVISSFSISNPDSGLTLSFDNTGTPSVNILGQFNDQYPQKMGYAKPQLDPTSQVEQIEVTSWDLVPEPEETDEIDYLYKFIPPDDPSPKVIVYNVVGTYDETVVATSTTTNKDFELSILQTLRYDTVTNTTYFKKYYPPENAIE